MQITLLIYFNVTSIIQIYTEVLYPKKVFKSKDESFNNGDMTAVQIWDHSAG